MIGYTDNKETLQNALKRIEELEKENTELKNKVENLQKYLDTQNCYRECAETWKQLTEAKELLARWVSDKPCTVSEHKDLISDTENFLKE